MAGGLRDLVGPVTAALARFRKGVLDALFPDFCGGCGREGAVACPDCWRAIPLVPEARRLDALAVWSVTRFQDAAVRMVVHALKYERRPEAAALADEALGRWSGLGALRPTRWTIVPVPMHAARLRRRGANQAATLAGSLAGRGLGAVTQPLVRVRRTVTQTALDRAARAKNVDGAFAVRGAVDPGAAYLLVDDVVTTGATLTAAAAALRQGGATRIAAWTFAAD